MSQNNPLDRLRQIIQFERTDLGILLAYGVGIGLLSLATPITVQALVNTIAFGALLQPLVVLTLILLALLAFSNTLVGLQFYVVEMLQRRLFVRFFGESAVRLQGVDYAQRDRQHLPELTNRFMDVVTLQKTSASLLLEALGYSLQTLIGMILLAFYHPLLLAFDLFLIATLYGIVFVLSRNGIPTAIEQSRAKYSALAWLENIAANGVLFKSRQGARFAENRTQQLAESYLQASVKHFRVLWRQNFAALVVHALANTVLLGMGGWMVIERQLSLGQLIAAELVVNAMVIGFTRIGKILDNFYELVASVDKLGYLLDLPQEFEQTQAALNAQTSIKLEIKDISVTPGLQLDLLQHFDLALEAGQHLVISQGAERGTLFDLICGLRAPNTGRIYLNQQDLRDFNLGALRDSVVLLRDIELIEGTIVENLDIGRQYPLSDIRKVLQQVDLLENLSALPDGLRTPLTLHGAPLTHEQSVRLMLARALLGQPRLLLVDKLLDRLPSEVLDQLLPALLRAAMHYTILVISHDADVIKHFSRHAHIENGQLGLTGAAQ